MLGQMRSVKLLVVSILHLTVIPVIICRAVTLEVAGAGHLKSAAGHLKSAASTSAETDEQRAASLVRRDLQSPEHSEENHGEHAGHQTAAAPSRNSLFTKRTRLVVPGHMALPRLVEVSGQLKGQSGSKTFTCADVFMKARDITEGFIASRTALNAADADVLPGGWVHTLHDKINTQTMGPDVTNLFADVLDNLDLGMGLTSGHVWTETDDTVWVECNSGVGTVDPSGLNSLEESNGQCLLQGDEKTSCTGSLLQENEIMEATMNHSRVVSNIWPAKAGSSIHEIAYCYASGINDEGKKGFEAAIEHIESQVPCLKFKIVTAAGGGNEFPDAAQQNCAQLPSLMVQSNAAGCWSYVGMLSDAGKYTGQSQPINMGKGCGNMGIAAHEIGHALGMLHEMARSDRDKYVKVKRENIATNMMANFEAADQADASTDFDFLSLMMYGSYDFSTNGELTVAPKDLRLVSFMGQRMGFSQLDIQLMGKLYGCMDTVTPLNANAGLSKDYITGGINTGFTGNCLDEEDSKTGWERKDKTAMGCTELKKYCNHDTLGEEIKKICPVSCFLCIPELGKDGKPLVTHATVAAEKKKSGATAQGNLLLALSSVAFSMVLSHVF